MNVEEKGNILIGRHRNWMNKTSQKWT